MIRYDSLAKMNLQSYTAQRVIDSTGNGTESNDTNARRVAPRRGRRYNEPTVALTESNNQLFTDHCLACRCKCH